MSDWIYQFLLLNVLTTFLCSRVRCFSSELFRSTHESPCKSISHCRQAEASGSSNQVQLDRNQWKFNSVSSCATRCYPGVLRHVKPGTPSMPPCLMRAVACVRPSHTDDPLEESGASIWDSKQLHQQQQESFQLGLQISPLHPPPPLLLTPFDPEQSFFFFRT